MEIAFKPTTIMQSSPPSAAPTETKANDSWSPTVIAVSAAYAITLVVVAEAAPVLLLFLVGIVPLVLISFFVWLCYDLITNRFRHALSLIAAVATAIVIVRCAPLISADKDTLSFYAHLPEYQRQIKQAQAHNSEQKPLRVVLDYQDRSIFVTANAFYYVIYDEMDGKGPDKTEFWPYAGSKTGVVAVTVPQNIHNLQGHYYNFTIGD
ncbi:hypothetical protein [Methylobacterium sp.]|uniref:hypothetical protein n=1 Tax=Methylobacterium sp. TaxID=409 RepID=UPI003AFFB875